MELVNSFCVIGGEQSFQIGEYKKRIRTTPLANDIHTYILSRLSSYRTMDGRYSVSKQPDGTFLIVELNIIATRN